MDSSTYKNDMSYWQLSFAVLVGCFGLIGCEGVQSSGERSSTGDVSGHSIASQGREIVGREQFYADGTPWVNPMPLSPGRVSPAQMTDRQWSEFVTQSGIQAERTTKTFTPTSWTGFSSDPSGDISYFDFGSIVFMWVANALTGTSDDVGMSLSGVPQELRPTANNVIVRCLVVNGSFTLGGAAEITTSGVIQFYLEDVSGGGAGTADDNKVSPQGSIFANTGTKGLPGGWLITYVKVR